MHLINAHLFGGWCLVSFVDRDLWDSIASLNHEIAVKAAVEVYLNGIECKEINIRVLDHKEGAFVLLKYTERS